MPKPAPQPTQQNPTLLSWLDDLTVRFLLNLPPSELASIPRLCFQVEEAQWFYEDFIRPSAPSTAPLPSLTLRQFCLLLFQHCPLLSAFSGEQHLAAYEEFLAYKVRVPVRGAILLDESLEKVVLVRGWKKGATWSFPRGKINKDEGDLACAVREVREETGFDIFEAGLVPESYVDGEEEGEAGVKYIDITMREQHIRLFVFRGVPLDTVFATQTRKEISKIAWYNVRDLPGFKKNKAQHPQQQHGGGGGEAVGESAHASKFYMVAPFLAPLKKWISAQRRQDAVLAQQGVSREIFSTATEMPAAPMDLAAATEEEDTEDQMMDQEHVLHPEAAEAQGGDLLAILQGRPTSQTVGEHVQRTFEPQVQHPSQQPLGQQQWQQHYQTQYHQMANLRPPPTTQLYPDQQQNFPHPNLARYRGHNADLPTPQPFGQQIQPANFPLAFPTEYVQPQPQMLYPQPESQFHPQLQQRQPQQLRYSQQSPARQFPAQFPLQSQPQPQLQPQHQNRVQNQPLQPQPSQGPQGTIAQGPAPPKASQLPTPAAAKLNPQALRLLDAFRTGGAATEPPMKRNDVTPVRLSDSNVTGNTLPSRDAGGDRQSALLDLFKRPAATAAASSTATAAPLVESAASPLVSTEPPLSPALTDTTEKPLRAKPQLGKRKTTLNEITRTLTPMNVSKTKTKATPGLSPGFRPAAGDFPPLSSKVVKQDTGLKAARDKEVEPLEQASPPLGSEARKKSVSTSPAAVKKILQRPGGSSGSATALTSSALLATLGSKREQSHDGNFAPSTRKAEPRDASALNVANDSTPLTTPTPAAAMLSEGENVNSRTREPLQSMQAHLQKLQPAPFKILARPGSSSSNAAHHPSASNNLKASSESQTRTQNSSPATVKAAASPALPPHSPGVLLAGQKPANPISLTASPGQRGGSRMPNGRGTPKAAPASPFASMTFQPQVLRRPTSGVVAIGATPGNESEDVGGVGEAENKTAKLLALFGRSAGETGDGDSSPQTTRNTVADGEELDATPLKSSAGDISVGQEEQGKTTLLKLLRSGSSNSVTSTTALKTPAPSLPTSQPSQSGLSIPPVPSAPRLTPSPSSRPQQPARPSTDAKPNPLLDLFKKPENAPFTSAPRSATTSPLAGETPISPFNLGSPITGLGHAIGGNEDISARTGTFTSPVSSFDVRGKGKEPASIADRVKGGKGVGSATGDTEFLMGYLNGIVRGGL